MNDGSASSAAAASPHHNSAHQDAALDHNESVTTIQLANRQKKTRENFQRKRIEQLDDLLRSVDMLVYAELSALYYLEYACAAIWNELRDNADMQQAAALSSSP